MTDLQYRPRHIVGLLGAWKIQPDWQLSGALEYVSSLPYYSRDTPASQRMLDSFVLLGDL